MSVIDDSRQGIVAPRMNRRSNTTQGMKCGQQRSDALSLVSSPSGNRLGPMRYASICSAQWLSFTLLTLAAASEPQRPREPKLSQQAFAHFLAKCAPHIHPLTMSAVAGVESKRYPLRIHINGNKQLAHQPYTLQQAVSTAIWLERRGFSFDVGIGQLNNANVRKYRLSWQQAFDPCTNLSVAGDILLGNFLAERPTHRNDQAAIQRALSRYNTGSPARGFSNGYVRKVEAEAIRLLKSSKLE